MSQSKIAIISHQKLYRRALAYLLPATTDFTVQGEYECSEDLGAAGHSGDSIIYIIDGELPASEIGAVIRLAHRLKNRSVILGSANYRKKLIELIPLKADGYFTTDLSDSDFAGLLKKVENGGPVISDSLLPELVNKFSEQAGEYSKHEKQNVLTPREKEIVKLLTTGRTNTQISKELIISIYTVKNHVHNILDKLGIKNRSELVSYALTYGLIDTGPKELPVRSSAGS